MRFEKRFMLRIDAHIHVVNGMDGSGRQKYLRCLLFFVGVVPVLPPAARFVKPWLLRNRKHRGLFIFHSTGCLKLCVL